MAHSSRMSNAVKNPLQLLSSEDADPGKGRGVEAHEYDEKLIEEEPAPGMCTPLITCFCGKFTRPAKGWILYDFSDSVLTIATSLFLPTYMKTLAEQNGYSDGNSFWAFTTSVATGVSVATFVIMGGVGEYGDYKNMLVRYGSYMAAVTLFLIGFTVVHQMVLVAAVLYVLCRMGDRVSGLMIDSLLSDVCQHHTKTAHAVSANGRFMGYVAMMIFGVLCAYAFLQVGDADEDPSLLWYARIPIMAAGVWWGVFAYIGFSWMGRYPGVPFPPEAHVGGLWGAMKWSAYTTLAEHASTLRKLPQFRDVSLFILAWMFLSDATSTASSLGTLIAEELNYGNTVIAGAVVVGIIFAALGMLMWMRVVKHHWLTPYQVLFINLCCQAAGALLLLSVDADATWQLFGVVILVSINLGPVSSYTRSLIVTMIPAGFQTNFLSFYELTQKGTAWIGPLIIATLSTVLGAEYFAALSIFTIIAELLVGLPIFWMVNVQRGQRLAKAYGEAERARKSRLGGGEDPELGDPNEVVKKGSAGGEMEMAVVNPAQVNGRKPTSESKASAGGGAPPGAAHVRVQSSNSVSGRSPPGPPAGGPGATGAGKAPPPAPPRGAVTEV